jgi:hypothetical protein
VAVSQALRRLLRVRNLEEEHRKLELESALDDLNRLETALATNVERESSGRRLVHQSAHTGDAQERLSGIEEGRTAKRYAGVLNPRIAAKRSEVATLRQEYLEKRVERRQAESLIEAHEAEETEVNERRGQQMLDDWYGARQHRQG